MLILENVIFHKMLIDNYVLPLYNVDVLERQNAQLVRY